jgi:cation diffusion facilitator CzcD-associated flavoprotein CzcO
MNDKVMRISADLCVVGAGIAALNALTVASGYLRKGQKVVLIEERARSGGMWNDAYPFVRLHQPHALFTAGAIPWREARPRSYLATREEILEHFDHIIEVVRARVELDERYGWEFAEHEEHGGRVLVRARNADGEQLEVDAAKLIKGFGIEVQPDAPLGFASERVRSIGPSAIVERADEVLGGTEPIWIVGAGKTGMDTAHHLLTEAPGREVNMIIGGGTFFGKRDRLFPDGRERWRMQATPNMLQAAVARRFDGTNEADVRRWLREKYGVGPVAEANNYFYGILSEAENAKIARGVTSTIRDYLTDVRDVDGRAELVFRSGATRDVPAGTWIVNCSGLITPVDRPYEPYSSPSGNVLTLSLRSATVLLSSFMAYFMTHLMYQDKLATTPLYQVDYSELAKAAKPASPYVMATLAQYNLCLLAEALPPRAFLDCGLDFDRWMPPPHRIAATVSFLARQRRDRPRMRAALDTVRDRFGVRCGPLDHAREGAVAT